MKGSGPRKASSPETEPDFYTMRFLPGSTPVVVVARKEKEQQTTMNQGAINQNFGTGGFGFESVSLHATYPPPPMATDLAMQAFSESRGFPSYEGSLSYLALQLAPPLPDTHAQALALSRLQDMSHLAMSPAAPVVGGAVSFLGFFTILLLFC